MPLADRIPRARPMNPRSAAIAGASGRVGTFGAHAPRRPSVVAMGAHPTPLPEVPT